SAASRRRKRPAASAQNDERVALPARRQLHRLHKLARAEEEAGVGDEVVVHPCAALGDEPLCVLARLGEARAHEELGDADPLAKLGDAEVQRRQVVADAAALEDLDRKSTRLNSSHVKISYAVFCLKKKKKSKTPTQ